MNNTGETEAESISAPALEQPSPAAEVPPVLPTAVEIPPALATAPVEKPPRKTAESNPFAIVTLYLLAVFLGAALIAPRFHATAQFIAEGHPAWRGIAEQPFHRYVGRSLLLFALVGLPSFLKALRIPSGQALGLQVRQRDWVEAIQGIAWGFAALAVVTALAISFGARKWQATHTANDIVRHVSNTALVALLVATIEEILFRGALFGALRRRYPFWPAALLSSAFYALVHFFQQPADSGMVQWYSGFVTLGQMLRGFVQWHALFPGFINLALLGVILALGFERTGSLLFSIALHASLIFWVKTVGFVTKTVDSANTWVWGGSKLVDGWASGLILLTVLLVLRKTLPGPRGEQDA